MLDVRLFRKDRDEIVALLGAKRYRPSDLDEALELDGKRRELLQAVEEARARKNEVSRRIASSDGDERKSLIAEMKQLGEAMAGREEELRQVKERFEQVVARLPNPPFPDVPGEPASEDVEGSVVKLEGEKPVFDFEPKDHLDICEGLGWLDMPSGARVSGSRFAFLHREAVLLQHALLSWVGSILLENGFILTIPPVLVRGKAMFDTGFFPAEEFEIYKLEQEDLYLVGTAEVPLASLHSDETVKADRLPLRYAGYSSCFRREAGAYGKDTRGIFRVHQFDKLEMFSFCRPDESRNEHRFLLGIEEKVLGGLGLHYRVVDIAASALGAPAARKYDLEAWFPGQGRYRELTSCSNCTDFQARRLGARMKDGKKKELLHTLNGTAVAVGRTLIAIIENYQTGDGRVRVPEVLRPYLPGSPEVLG